MICSAVTVWQVLIIMKPLLKDLVMPACVILVLASLNILVIKEIINALSVDLMVQVFTARDVQAMTIMWSPWLRIVSRRRTKWKQKNLVCFHLFMHNSVHVCTYRGVTDQWWFQGIPTPNPRKHCVSVLSKRKRGFLSLNF